ncbi:MAG: sodium:proton antiporter [Phycisphaerales bacterium]|jgi:Na+/H+ antiporter NhaD/arsenite permease-like protein|nr:sodium:proton antiporter [Phycisphaerales bacterium]
MGNAHGHEKFHGPKCWALSAVVGAVLGVLVGFVAPGSYDHAHHAGGTASHQPGHSAHDDGHDHTTAGTPGPSSHATDPQGEDAPGAAIAWTGDGEPTPASALPHHAEDGAAHADAHSSEHAEGHDDHGTPPVIPLWLVLPFGVMLLSIALMPFINERFWHSHFPDFAFLLGGIVAAYYLTGFSGPEYSHGLTYGQYQLKHTAIEYYSFIALIGGLFVASGGILVDVRTPGRPLANTILLAIGAVIANIVGTTGASVLLIRPFMRMNKGRLNPMHVVFFIFIVSNCGGCLTPIGDPPLYLGFLKGVPFFWTLEHLWSSWAFTIGMLLALFFAYDTRVGRGDAGPVDPAQRGLRVSGMSGIIALALIIGGVFIDPLLKKHAGIEGVPVGATFQLLVAIGAYMIANRENQRANEFSFFPVKEVGLLFIGIFATMMPALGYLATHGSQLGIDSPTTFYFATGALSAFLDNAPTYLNFMQVAFGEVAITPENIHAFTSTRTGSHDLMAISLGAVFFGAMTYIGNGPNFMVKAIAEASGLKMPSFFGYLARSLAFLLPLLIITWLFFVR